MDVVLVHGTTQTPAGWQPLTEALTERGHRVATVDLTDAGPDQPVAEHVASAVRALDGVVHRPVLVGHSGAGVLLPALAAALDASRLVWLAALLPDAAGGRSVVEQFAADGPAMFGDEWRTLREPPTADPVLAAYFLFHDCPLATLRWALGTVRLFYPRTAYAEPPPPALPDVPSHYLLPTGDRTLRPDWMRAAARQRLGVTAVELDAGHCPHVSAPGAVADLIY